MKRVSGVAAIEAARNGARLYVRNAQHGLVPVPNALESIARACRMEPHALWIYVADAVRPFDARFCAARASGRNLRGEATTWLPQEALDLWREGKRDEVRALFRVSTRGPRAVLP